MHCLKHKLIRYGFESTSVACVYNGLELKREMKKTTEMTELH